MSLLCSSPLSIDERRVLLGRARQAITEAVCAGGIADFPLPAGRLGQPGSAFVTVHCAGRLRGCVGRTDRALPLAETVVQCAISAGIHDARFRPLQPAELSEVDIEISVLSEAQPIKPQAIETGRHGLAVSRGDRRGLLLPQVAAGRRWSAMQFLEETCRKAGLEPTAWQDPETKVLGFTAEVFSESELASDGTCAEAGFRAAKKLGSA